VFKNEDDLIQRLQITRMRRILAVDQHTLAGPQFRLSDDVIVAAVTT